MDFTCDYCFGYWEHPVLIVSIQNKRRGKNTRETKKRGALVIEGYEFAS